MSPKHPTSPPYRSSLVVSRSKETEKHMTTVPKPIAHSRWNIWGVKFLDKNILKWYPIRYEEILDHLFSQWEEISVKTLETMDQKARKLAFVHYNPKMDIEDLKAWSIHVEDQVGIPDRGWSWQYDPPESRYLLYAVRKDLQDRITTPEGLLNVKEILNSVIGIILANSNKL